MHKAASHKRKRFIPATALFLAIALIAAFLVFFGPNILLALEGQSKIGALQ